MSLKLDPTFEGESDSPEEACVALLRIDVGSQLATEVDDSFSHSVRPFVRVSCLPLARWIAASWWRLHYEVPLEANRPGAEWRATHCMAAAGSGYLWPRLTFVPDLETIEVTAEPSARVAAEPQRFLNSFRERLPRKRVEDSLKDFVNTVLNRLDATGLHDVELKETWAEIHAEERDAEVSRLRRLEAELGSDPGELDAGMAERCLSIIRQAGHGSDEVALAIAARPDTHRGAFLDWLEAPQGGTSIEPKLPVLPLNPSELSSVPWERGWRRARSLRSALHLAPDQPVRDSDLDDLLGVKLDSAPGNAPLSLIHRAKGRVAMYLRRTRVQSRRFEASRFIGDQCLVAGEGWIVSSDAASARQKAQRAFAAEFLAPIEALRSALGGDFSDEAINDVAERFGVSSLLVKSHLANNGDVSREAVRLG